MEDNIQNTANNETINKETINNEVKTYTEEELNNLLKEKEDEWNNKKLEDERLAKLTEQERKKELENKYKDDLLKKEKDLTNKEIQLILTDTFAKEKLDFNLISLFSKDKYVNVDDKEKVIKEDIQTLKTTINEIVNKQVEEFKKDYLKGKTPNLGNTETTKQLNPLDLIINKL